MEAEHNELAELFRTSHRRVTLSIFFLTGDMSEAEDVVQETFVRAVIHHKKVLSADSPEAWLLRVSRNLAITRWRQVQNRAAVLKRNGFQPPPVPEPGPDRVAMIDAIKALPQRQREAIAMHYLADLPVEASAEALGVTGGTIKSRLSRGRSALAPTFATA